MGNKHEMSSDNRDKILFAWCVLAAWHFTGTSQSQAGAQPFVHITVHVRPN
jgi:hypothetical protein